MLGFEPEVCNCAALRQAARRVTRLYDEALAPTGLGANQYSILVRLSGGPSTIQELAQRLVMDRSTLGHLLRPLEKRGLVRTQPCHRADPCRTSRCRKRQSALGEGTTALRQRVRGERRPRAPNGPQTGSHGRLR